MTLGNIIVGLVILVLVVLAAGKLYMDKKSGKGCSSCGGSCSGCGGHCSTSDTEHKH